MRFSIDHMNEADAFDITSWHYEEPYTFYDMDQDPDDLAEFLDSRSWAETLFSVRDEGGELVGFFQFTQYGETLDIGLGLRPDLTGKGIGPSFLQAGLEYAREHFSPGWFQLSVATFNERAIRVYERAGFQPKDVYMHASNGGEFQFLRMEMPARSPDQEEQP